MKRRESHLCRGSKKFKRGCIEAWVGKTLACSPLVAEALSLRRAVEVSMLHRLQKVII